MPGDTRSSLVPVRLLAHTLFFTQMRNETSCPATGFHRVPTYLLHLSNVSMQLYSFLFVN